MTGIRIVEFISLDGVVQAPGHSREDPDGFAHGGWTQPYFTSHATGLAEVMGTAGGFLFGRRTFEIFAAYWPSVTDPSDRIAAALNARPKFVASRRLDASTRLAAASWTGTTILTEDVAEQAAAVALELDGDLVLLGSSLLAQSLIRHDVVDRYQLWLHPVVLGSGKRLFADRPQPTTVQLSHSHRARRTRARDGPRRHDRQRGTGVRLRRRLGADPGRRA